MCWFSDCKQHSSPIASNAVAFRVTSDFMAYRGTSDTPPLRGPADVWTDFRTSSDSGACYYYCYYLKAFSTHAHKIIKSHEIGPTTPANLDLVSSGNSIPFFYSFTDVKSLLSADLSCAECYINICSMRYSVLAVYQRSPNLPVFVPVAPPCEGLSELNEMWSAGALRSPCIIPAIRHVAARDGSSGKFTSLDSV